jgi:hypothetical protein
MAPQLDNGTIRKSSPPQLAKYFQECLESSDWKTVSDHLLASVTSGSIPPSVFHVWLSVCKDAGAVGAALRQDISLLVRHVAIRRFGKWLRTEDGFPAIWKASGEAKGLVDLMATFSVNEVTLMCETLALSRTSHFAARQRQKALSELYNTLIGVAATPNPDTRPLLPLYSRIVPACTPETAVAHTKDLQPDLKTCLAHASTYQKLALGDMFPGVPDDDNKKNTVTRHKLLLNENRDFAVHVLRRFATDEVALQANKDVFVTHVAIPLVRRLCHKRINDGTQERVLDMIIECARKEPGVALGINLKRHGLIYYATHMWKRSRGDRRQRMEELLGCLIRLLPHKTSINFVQERELMQRIPSVLRYPLLRLLLLNETWHAFDLDSENDETSKKLKEIGDLWHVGLFLDLSAEPALHLFTRLLLLHPDGKFIWPQGEVRNHVVFTKIVGENRVDPDIVLAFLTYRVSTGIDRNPARLAQAKKGIEERKKQAATSREWEDRANWAESALKLSIATGSLDLYADTLLWARRFNRDAQTVKRLYQSSTVLTNPGLDLLSGIPSTKVKGPLRPLDEINEQVMKGNKIIFQFLETAAMGIQEPSFVRYDWNSVLQLVPDVLRRRIERVQELQEKHVISNDAVFNLIWQPTIELLLDVERFGLKDEHARLEFQNIDGPLETWGPVTPTVATCMFLDSLAEKRDMLWKKYRPQVHPATTTLGRPWPQGLPIQLLCPEIQQDSQKQKQLSMPYLESRAVDVVFMDGSSVLIPPPEDSETEVREAIGPFVDSYKFALSTYLQGAKDDGDRDVRLRKAWKHAVTELTSDRMSADEATQFWGRVFNNHRLEEVGLVPITPRFFPELPEEAETPSEWDPYPNFKALRVESRILPETCLDCMINVDSSRSGWGSSRTVNSAFQVPTSSTVGKDPTDFWDVDDYRDLLPGPAKDALAVAAVAYINTRFGSDTTLLLKSVPSEDDARFPAFYLDQEFLERDGKGSSAEPALVVLDHLSSNMPIDLLVHLAESLIARLNNGEKEDPDVREAAMRVVKRLARGDCPAIACDFIQQIVLDRQDDSSWHRHLFNVGYLCRLPAKEAKTFFNDLSSKIQTRLETQAEEQAKRQASKVAANEAEPPAPAAALSLPPGFKPPSGDVEKPVEKRSVPSFMKITTVKMVAQMLRNASYVDEQFACGVLVGLFEGATNPDIQLTIVESLQTILVDTKDKKLQEAIYRAFETHVIPIAASLNERRLTTEEEWLAAESGEGALPEVYVQSPIADLPPMLQLLVATLNHWKTDSPGFHNWASRILIPIAEKSAANNARWNALFIKRQGFDVREDYLATVPVKPKLLIDLWNRVPEAFTRSNFEALKAYSLANLIPDSSIISASEVVRNDAELLKSNGGKHWLFLWENPCHAAFNLGVNQIVSTLQQLAPRTPETGEVQIRDMQDFVASLAEYFIHEGDVTEFQTLMNALSNGNKKDVWMSNCLPLLERFINRIEGLRIEEWQRDQKRTPAILPQTFPITLEIMKKKHTCEHSPADKPSQKEVSDFVAEISSLIDEMLADNAPYHEEWIKFKQSVKQTLRRTCSNWHWLRVAVELTNPSGVARPRPSLADYLKIEIAEGIFRYDQNQQLDEEAILKAKEVLRSWVESPVERIRTTGAATVKLLRQQGKDKNGWWGKEQW